MNDHLTPEAVIQIEESFSLTSDAIRLLDLVNSEFQSDPQSVQCFDMSVVNEIKKVIKKIKANPQFEIEGK